MKKLLLITSAILSVNTFSYKIVSDYNGIFGNIFLNEQIKDTISNRYEYNYDLAVVSDMKDTKSKSLSDAMEGIENVSYNYAKDLLNIYLKKANLSGPGFNEIQMTKFAKEIARQVLIHDNLVNEGVWMDENNNYFTLLKIDKLTVQSLTKKIFLERLDIIINELSKLREELNDKSY